METRFTAIAPGRLCLFGEHQDYLGFPVIALALPLIGCKIDVVVTVTDDDSNDRDNGDDHLIIHLHLPESLGGETKKYDLDCLPQSPPTTRQEGEGYDFALAAIHEALKAEKLNGPHNTDKSGIDDDKKRKHKVEVHCTSSVGELPLCAGCSSSTAFITAFVLVLKRIFRDGHNRRQQMSTKLLAEKSIENNNDNASGGCTVDGDGTLLELAKLAHRAEVTHFGNPGGTMDHVAIAVGSDSETKESDHKVYGALRIGPDPWKVEPLPVLPSFDSDDNKDDNDNGVWILAYSGEPKDTMKHLKRCKYDRLSLLQQKLKGDWDHPIGSESTLSETEIILRNATITNRDTEEAAAKLWRSCDGSPHQSSTNGESVGRALANLMKEHHEALRDGLGLSTPRLEAMNQAAVDAGAWAFKVVGSGGGGCGVAWAPFCKATEVAKAMENVVGAGENWIIERAGRGAHIVSNDLA